MQMPKFKTFLLAFFLILTSLSAYALSLTAQEVKQANDLSMFFDKKPFKEELSLCIDHSKSKNIFIQGLSNAILAKHYPMNSGQIFAKSITLNSKKVQFKQNKATFVLLTNLEKLLKTYEPMLESFKDERLRSLFLFYYFREKNTILIGNYKERLDLAAFYRLSFLTALYKSTKAADKLVQMADK